MIFNPSALLRNNMNIYEKRDFDVYGVHAKTLSVYMYITEIYGTILYISTIFSPSLQVSRYLC